MKLIPFEHTLREDMPVFAARRGDVIVVRPQLPDTPVVLWRLLSDDEAERLLTSGPLKIYFVKDAEPSKRPQRGLRLIKANPPKVDSPRNRRRLEGGAA